MTERPLRWLLLLYPKDWRDRYGKEFGDLSAELLASGETTRLRIAFGVVGSALAERVASMHRLRFVAVVSGSAALVVVAGAAVFLLAANPREAPVSPSPHKPSQSHDWKVATVLPSGIAAALAEQGESYSAAVAVAAPAIDQRAAELKAVASSGRGTKVLAAELVTYHAVYGTGLVWLVSVDPRGEHLQISLGPKAGSSPYNFELFFVDPSSGALERLCVGTSSDLPQLPNNP